MKIRNGFVSNSSTTSFVVMFKNETLDDERLKDTFNEKEKELINILKEDLHLADLTIGRISTLFGDDYSENIQRAKRLGYSGEDCYDILVKFRDLSEKFKNLVHFEKNYY
jgi:hypothetical protein